MTKKKKEFRPRLSQAQYNRHMAFETGSNVLVIGDLHAPFIREGYLEHCKHVYDMFACNQVVFIGDVIDSHYSSYHETDPDGYSAGEELERAIDALKPFYEAFPNAYVTLGNHDLIVMRKAYSSGLSKRWIKDFGAVLETPNWKFVEEIEIDGVVYTHGTGQSSEHAAFLRAVYRQKSFVMGHVHTAANVKWSASDKDRVFGMQVGCGVDERAYAFQYGRTFRRKMIVSCGVVLDSGNVPIVVPMAID